MSPAQSWAFPLPGHSPRPFSLPSGQPGEVTAQTQRRLSSKVRGSVSGEVRESKKQEASEGNFRITHTVQKGKLRPRERPQATSG